MVRRLFFPVLVGLTLLALLILPRLDGGVPRLNQPIKVKDAFELASRVVPGWDRAEAAGEIVRLDQVAWIGAANGTIQLEALWSTERSVYLLYTTTKTDQGDWLVATEPRLRHPADTEWEAWGKWHPQGIRPQAGGFSARGYHQVLEFERSEGNLGGDRVFTNKRWLHLRSSENLWEGRERSAFDEVAIRLTVPEPKATPVEAVRLTQSGEWLGRGLRLSALRMGTSQTELIGQVRLAPGESNPGVGLWLKAEKQDLAVKAVQFGAPDAQGWVPFTVTAEPANLWPVPVSVEVAEIRFQTEGVLTLPVPWGAYRSLPKQTAVKPADAIMVPFYDGGIRLLDVWDESRGFTMEFLPPARRPGVRLAFVLPDGREGKEGVALIGPNGERVTNFGQGMGPHLGKGRGERLSIALPGPGESDEPTEWLATAERFVVEYRRPWAVMEIGESWSLVK